MRIAIVDVGWKKINPINPTGEALGGSETWLVQISNEFAKQGHVVNVYCACDFSCKLSDNLFYSKFEDFLTKREHFDFVILNRFFEKGGLNYIDFIKKNEMANHVYIQIHDLSFVMGGRLLESNSDVSQYNLNDDFVTVVTLNTWHQRNLLAQYPSLSRAKICIPNGIDLSLFKENKEPRDNRIIWSSCAERGLDILLNDVYPLVKAQVEDFGVDVAGYNNFDPSTLGDKDVRYLGKLTKEELYKEQSKHKLWFYPGTFAETFCITMLENVMNGCQIVSPITYGMDPTIGYASQIRMRNSFITSNTYQEAVNEAAQKIVEILKSNQSAPDVYQQIKQKIRTEYNWTNSVNLYVNDYQSNKYGKVKEEIENHNKKILILSMSCNIPYFRTLLSVTKDTWVKPILQGKYENCIWFSYTCCDAAHKTPHIDFDDHMIYVDCPDDIKHTYEKTQKAYRMLKDAGIEFDYVLRTNTSVFVNLKNTIECINQRQENEVMGMTIYFGGLKLFPGLFFGMSKKLFDIAMSKNNNYMGYPQHDDMIISRVLFDTLGDNLKIVGPYGNESNSILRYKPFLEGDENIYKVDAMYKDCIVRDPKIINDVTILQVRPIYIVPDYNDSTFNLRFSRGHEFEHFYELLDALD